MNIVWNQSQGAHRDMVLSFHECDIWEVADSYYLGLDAGFLAGNESPVKVRLALGILLGEWIRQIGTLGNVGDRCFLPFDFSDEYIGGIRVQMMEGDEVVISYGVTREYGGYAIYPSRLFDVIFDDSLFSISSKRYLLGREELMLKIRRNLVGVLQ
jgi:hypothetical protein